jgi:hypothetical protein
MKILGIATALDPATTKFTTSTAIWLSNTTTDALTVTLRNVADDANLGSISIPASYGVAVNLDPGQGVRGSASIIGTKVDAASGY